MYLFSVIDNSLTVGKYIMSMVKTAKILGEFWFIK